MVDSLFVGETDTIGNPVTPEEIAYGRSLPKRLKTPAEVAAGTLSAMQFPEHAGKR